MNLMERFRRTFSFTWGVGTIEFGAGKAAQLGNIAKAMKVRNLIIVTDKGIVKSGIITKIEEPLKASKIAYTIFDEVEPNPLDRIVDKGANLAREIKASAVIGLGGGSSIDAGKAVRVRDLVDWTGKTVS